MICKHCGNNNGDHAKFCGKCGKPLNGSNQAINPQNFSVNPGDEKTQRVPEELLRQAYDPRMAQNPGRQNYQQQNYQQSNQQQINYQQPNYQQPNYQQSNQQQMNYQRAHYQQANGQRSNQQYAGYSSGKSTKSNKKGSNKKLIIGLVSGGVASLVLLIALVCFLVLGGKKINLNNYVKMNTYGYNGIGHAEVSIDWEGIEQKYGSKISFRGSHKDDYDVYYPVEILREYVSVTIDKNAGLSNGDEVKYEFEVNDDIENILNCKLKYEDKEVEVSGLEKADTFDAFAEIKVEFSGIAPNGIATINYQGSEFDADYYFEFDQQEGLSNGDKVTLRFVDDYVEEFAESYHKVPEALEKTYTVDGLESYLTSASQLNDEMIGALKQQGKDAFNSYVANDWGDGTNLKSVNYIGNYLLTAKSSSRGYGFNYLYLIFKAKVQNYYSNGGDDFNKTHTLYWFVEYEDVMVKPDGSSNVDLTRYDTPGASFEIDSNVSYGWGTKYWYYRGYQSLDQLYNDVITKNLADYNHEDNINENNDSSKNDEKSSSGDSEKNTEKKKSAKDGYVIADSDTRILTKDDLTGLTKDELKIARNEICARHGRKFKDKALQKHFDKCSWYKGTIEADDFTDDMLNATETANINFILKYEQEKGYQ